MKPPSDITIPDAGSTTARRWLGAYLKRLLVDLLEIPMRRFDASTFDAFSDARAHLQKLAQGGDAGLVFSILRRTTHSTLIRCLHTELWGGGDVQKLDAWLRELTALIAFELAAAGALPSGGIRIGTAPPRILSTSSNLCLRFDSKLRIGFEAGDLVLENGGTTRVELGALRGDAKLPDGLTVERPYHPIADGVLLACADNNPLSDFEAHPEKSGNALDLGERPAREWTDALGAALALVDEHLPELGREIRLVMQILVPVGYDRQRHLSASYAEAIGTAYLTLHPDPMTMAEALVHEFSHNKINVLWALDRVLDNAYEPKFTSPVRPDPRPLHGILLAVHAFVPVARLYEKMREAGHPLSKEARFQKRYEQIVAGNSEGIATLLENGQATPVGQGVLDELAKWDRHFTGA